MSARYYRADRIRWFLATLTCIFWMLAGGNLQLVMMLTWGAAEVFSPDMNHRPYWLLLFPWLRDVRTSLRPSRSA